MDEPTKSEGLRLPLSVWEKLRALMRYNGNRTWLEKIINREYRKVFEK